MTDAEQNILDRTNAITLTGAEQAQLLWYRSHRPFAAWHAVKDLTDKTTYHDTQRKARREAGKRAPAAIFAAVGNA